MRIVSSTLGVDLEAMKLQLFVVLLEHNQLTMMVHLLKRLNQFLLSSEDLLFLELLGHTFEYLGYGPGNYSTGLPQVQVTTLTEREEFLFNHKKDLVVLLFIMV
jgi:hypothetical protein